MTSRDRFDHMMLLQNGVSLTPVFSSGRRRSSMKSCFFFLGNKFLNFRSGCEDRPDMERPKIQMMVNDGEEEELVELAAPSADAAIRLKSGDIKYTVKGRAESNF